MSFTNDIKHWFRDLFRYPRYHSSDASYDVYWSQRDMGQLNSFQKTRADYILSNIQNGDSVLDVGCGDGRTLAYIHEQRPAVHLRGVDSSPAALTIARERGLDVRPGDVEDLGTLGHDMYDYVVVFEVLEHMPNSEELLAWAVAHARKAVLISVPNTGFLMHRLRLLSGRFPLQWRAHPSEHVRFWTLRDMRWWLVALGYDRAQIVAYEGVPILNRIWPSLFGCGLIVSLPKK